MKDYSVCSKLVVACLSFLLFAPCDAQLIASDSDFYRAAMSSVLNQYYQAIGDQSALYNGRAYPGYPYQFKGEGPFFNSGKSDTGWVFYDNILYSGLQLYYDDLSEIVLIDDNGSKIELNNKKLDDFSIGGHHFTQLKEQGKSHGDINTGFYEVLYTGNIRVLKKTIKRAEDDVSDSDVVQKLITTSHHFYLEKQGLVRPVDNTSELTAILSEKKKEILRFLKRNKLKFRKDPENTLLRVAAYFDQ